MKKYVLRINKISALRERVLRRFSETAQELLRNCLRDCWMENPETILTSRCISFLSSTMGLNESCEEICAGRILSSSGSGPKTGPVVVCARSAAHKSEAVPQTRKLIFAAFYKLKSVSSPAQLKAQACPSSRRRRRQQGGGNPFRVFVHSINVFSLQFPTSNKFMLVNLCFPYAPIISEQVQVRSHVCSSQVQMT